ncbi:MAG: cupin domain-containing protein [Verrucomicrobia bacterium]|nr:cupin domain-containing protein [Verrucomicrobiota bacterium]MCH8528994.1 cupin domain-containing protein [Kiritimatiellia bacterium]
MKSSLDIGETGLPRNLFDSLPEAVADEVFETLIATDKVRIVRITSHGQSTPEGEWYDQPDHEWVTVLRGAARILVEGQGEHPLGPGDTLFLPAHCRHRVTWTDPEVKTVWLAVHFALSTL